MTEKDRSADPYASPQHYCDIVMKGGITSGVVYPNAICELAATYRFKSVGGTSAGAIAAAATAAAEYGRRPTSKNPDAKGFARLAALGDELAQPGRVKALFEPQRSTRRLFGVLIGVLEGGFPGWFRVARSLGPLLLLLGAAPGAALLVLSIAHWSDDGFDALALLGCTVGMIALVLGALALVAFRLVRIALRRVADNNFGICSGAATGREDDPKALTPWLTGLLNDAAGLPAEEPLTFAHLWAGPEGDRDHPPEEGKRVLELEMMTTNLVNRIAQRLPWHEGHYYFDPGEFRDLFPDEVVEWMEAHPRPLSHDDPRDSELHRAMMWPRLPLPAAGDLPVVVAARLSLSFPVLLSAVPLWRFDFELPRNTDRQAIWREWLSGEGAGWRLPEDGRESPGLPSPLPAKLLDPDQCWFSDGGISSNFPIHFFDRVLPGRPTFAINLRPFRLEEDPNEKDQAKNVEMATTNNDEIADWWYRLPKRKRRVLVRDSRLPSFLMAAVGTMQNRIDEAQMRAPGFRDRVAHVKLSGDEGGMNLTMPHTRVEALVKRGEEAAQLLRQAYTAPAGAQPITWENHRWVRLRTALAIFEQMHEDFAEGFAGEGEGVEAATSYAELLARPKGAPPTSYPLEPGQLERAQGEVGSIGELGGEGPEAALANGAPKPRPVGRIVPRD
jgi:predicted acylesterase/phospholipase RssA